MTVPNDRWRSVREELIHWAALLVLAFATTVAIAYAFKLDELQRVLADRETRLTDAVRREEKLRKQLAESEADREHDRRLWLDCEAEVADYDRNCSRPLCWRGLNED